MKGYEIRLNGHPLVDACISEADSLDVRLVDEVGASSSLKIDAEVANAGANSVSVEQPLGIGDFLSIVVVEPEEGATAQVTLHEQRSPSDGVVYCSFCEKANHEVAKIIQGGSSSICNECVGLCNDVLASEL
ncbi:MAG: hypothetical protein K0U93_09190 [Gammaproteobacteria bacterium]|nr:hypothetical protein [Gammaproteobacteria bacterium]